MASLGQLVVSLTAETAQFKEALSKAAYETDRAMKKIESSTSFVSTAFKTLLTAGVVAQVTSGVNSIIESMARLEDISKTTGSTVENLSGLASQARIVGVDMNTLESVLIKFNKALFSVENEANTTEKALRAIGLSSKELRQMDTVDATYAVARALQEYADDANKAAIITAIFGKSAKEISPFLDDLAKNGKMNAVVTAQQAEAAGKLQDEVRKLGLEFDKFTTGILSRAIPALLEFFKTLNSIIQPYAILGNNIEELEGALAKVNATIEKNTSLGKENSKSNLDLQKGLQSRIGFLKEQKRIEEEIANNANKPKKKADADLKDYTKGLASINESNMKFLSSVKDLTNKINMEMQNVFSSDTEKKLQANLLSLQKMVEDAATSMAKQLAEKNITPEQYAQGIKELSLNYVSAIEVATKLKETQDDLNSSYSYGAAVALSQYINQAQNLANASSGIVTNGLRSMEDALFGVISGTMSASQAFSSMVKSILADITKLMIRQSIVSPLAGLISGSLGSFFGGSVTTGTTSTGLMSFDGVGYGGGRALGGDVNAGTSYLVGERGPEIFTPSMNGAIIPNGTMGGSTNVVINNYSNSQATANETIDSRGNRRIEVTIGDIVASEMARSGSAMSNTLRTSYGAKQNLVGR
jgi:lambda family phage tail tape measure protein